MKSGNVIDRKKGLVTESPEAEASDEELRGVSYTGIFLICLVIAVLAGAVSAVWQGVEGLLALG